MAPASILGQDLGHLRDLLGTSGLLHHLPGSAEDAAASHAQGPQSHHLELMRLMDENHGEIDGKPGKIDGTIHGKIMDCFQQDVFDVEEFEGL